MDPLSMALGVPRNWQADDISEPVNKRVTKWSRKVFTSRAPTELSDWAGGIAGSGLNSQLLQNDAMSPARRVHGCCLTKVDVTSFGEFEKPLVHYARDIILVFLLLYFPNVDHVGYGNIAPEPHIELIEAGKAKDYKRARNIHDQLLPVTKSVYHRGSHMEGTVALKHALVARGILQHANVRPPSLPIPEGAAEEIHAAVSAARLAKVETRG